MRFVPNRNIEAEILRSMERRRSLEPLAERGAELARSNVAVDDGELLASIGTEEGQGGAWRIVARARHWIFVEFGTVHMDAQPFLRPLALRLGLRVTKR